MNSTPPFLLRESTNTSSQLIEYIQHTYNASLGPDHGQIPQPAAIKIPLRNHQKTLVASCAAHEERMHAGYVQHDASGRKFITRGSIGIIGDPVGAGKTLSALSFIAHMKENSQPHTKNLSFIRNSSTDGYTIYHRTYDTADPNNCKNLILVPYSLIPQWRGFIKTQTNLQPYIIKAKADISGTAFHDHMRSADLTLVSSTMYTDFIHAIEESPLWWERFFVDEADSIKIPRARFLDMPTVLFKWYITASWTNIILDGVHIHRDGIENYMHTHLFQNLHPQTVNWVAEYLHNYPNYYNYHNSYRSSNYLENSVHIKHPNSYINILQTSADYYRQSFNMPPVHTHVHTCRRTAINAALNGLVDRNIQQLIDADDIQTAMSALHLNTSTVGNLLEAVEARYIKDIHNIQTTISYRESLEYVSQQHKEEAIAALRRSKERAETQLQTFRDRLGALKNESPELCPICYDTPADVIYTPCCQRIFCAGCILKCLRMNGACPMCRTRVGTGQLVHVQNQGQGTAQPPPSAGPPKKRDRLLQLLKEKPTGRFLVFSHHDNPFEGFGTDCDDAHISYKILKGNMNVIAKAVEDFEAGKIQVLFLNSKELGVGMNLITATDVILYHALTPEEEKQVVGRALRMGRTAPLHVHKLHHEGEVPERY